MSGTTIRQQFMREFRGLKGHSRLACSAIVAGYLAQILLAVAIGHWLLSMPASVGSALGMAAVVLFIGTRLRGFNNIVHECSHFTFAHTRQDNYLFGKICASLVLSSFHDYRDEHMTHHAHLGDYEHDLDLQGIQDLRLEDPLTPRTILRHAINPFLGRHLPYYLNANLSARDGFNFRLLKLALIFGACVYLVIDPISALLFVWLPYVFMYSAINYWTDCIDHGGLVHSDDELDASRNVALPMPLRTLLFPRNDCFHLVHHLFPQIPSRHLEACHNRLMSHPEYRTRIEGGRPITVGGAKADAGLQPAMG